MGQILRRDSIGEITRPTTTTIAMAASRVTIGGRQYLNESGVTLSSGTVGFNGLDAGGLGNRQIWYVYAVVQNGLLGLVASMSDVAPAGFLVSKWTGSVFVTSSTASIAFVTDDPHILIQCLAHKATNQLIATGTQTIIQLDTIVDEFPVPGLFVFSTNDVAVPLPTSRYDVHGYGRWNANATGVRRLGMRINGAAADAEATNAAATGTGSFFHESQAKVRSQQLNGGQTFGLYVQQTSGGGIDIGGGSGANGIKITSVLPLFTKRFEG